MKYVQFPLTRKCENNQLLCWIAIVLTSISTVFKFLFYPGFDSQIIALLNGAGRVALLLLLKYMSQILIDISDSSLFRLK